MTGKKLTGLPTLSLLKWNYYKWIKEIKMCYLLDHLDYNRSEAIKLLSQLYGYKEYGDKHGESGFTKWFQEIYLPQKFNIDKRKAHYSSLIVSGQMTRDAALEKLKIPLVGKLDKSIPNPPKRDYREFKTDEKLFNAISKIIKLCRF
jgi:hypothetical protein